MRREERVTVQGPVKEQQPNGMSHRGSARGVPLVTRTPPPPSGSSTLCSTACAPSWSVKERRRPHCLRRAQPPPPAQRHMRPPPPPPVAYGQRASTPERTQRSGTRARRPPEVRPGLPLAPQRPYTPPPHPAGAAVSPSHQRLGGAGGSSAVWAAVSPGNRRSGPGRAV